MGTRSGAPLPARANGPVVRMSRNTPTGKRSRRRGLALTGVSLVLASFVVFATVRLLRNAESQAILPGLAGPTSTPDLRHSLQPREAAERLANVQGIGPVVVAVRQGDIDAFLGLIDWQSVPCGSPRGSADVCPDGVQQFTELPMVDVGYPVPFWATAETVRPTLELLLRGEPLLPRVALQSRAEPGRFYIAFAGPAKGGGLLPLASEEDDLTGLMVEIDTSRQHPIVRFSTVSRQWRATAFAHDLGLDDKDILVWDDGF